MNKTVADLAGRWLRQRRESLSDIEHHILINQIAARMEGLEMRLPKDSGAR